jgi:hypothetical protein
VTMTTDEMLESLFRRAGDAFEIPEGGAEEILNRSRHGEDLPEDPEAPIAPVRDIRGAIRSHRLLAVAASVVLIVVVAGGSVLLTHKNPAPKALAGVSALASPPHSSEKGTLTVPSTTVVPQLGSAPLAQAGAGTGGVAAGALPQSAAAGSTGTTNGVTATGTSGSPAAPALPAGAVGSSAKIEQNGSLELVVANGSLSVVMSKLAFLATANNGFVANSQTQTGAQAGTPYGSVTLQVPVDSFDVVLKEAQALGRTEQLSTKATDVTGQYVDLQSRITALEASRTQYLTIMARATSIGDVLAVQSQLDNLQSQIEQLQGQLAVLTSQTAYSTLNVQVSERGTFHHVTPHHPESGVAKAWHDSVHGFVDGVEGLIRIAGPILFVLLCLGALVFGGRLGWRRWQRRNL